MSKGYIKLWRKALDNDWLKNHELWVFWTYCLLRARHKAGAVKVGFQEITLQPGQFIFGRLQAARDLAMSEWKIRHCLTFLKSSGNLTSKTTNKFSIITIINWETYQGMENGKPPAKPPATHQPPTTNKNVKKGKKKNLDQKLIEYRLSQTLLDFILKRRAGFLKPDLMKWATQIDLMIRKDQRDANEIEKVIGWCQQDPFWQNNILSTGKLRKQFDKLALQMESQGQKDSGAVPPPIEYY